MEEENANDDDDVFVKRLRQIKSFKEVVFPSVDGNIKSAQARQKKNYDAQHTAPTFSIGEEVLKKNLKNKHRMGGKLDAKWLGPYIITGVSGHGNYILQCKQSGDLLKHCVPSTHLKKYIYRPALKV